MAIANWFLSTSYPLPTDDQIRIPWDAGYLNFSVREPWVSKMSRANLVFGKVERGAVLEVESNMPEGGVIFSDGIEDDFLKFTSGMVAKITVAEKAARLIVG
ncbi:MAG: hypothetical protein ACTSU5_19235 [Promethearchaeota archaeon]